MLLTEPKDRVRYCSFGMELDQRVCMTSKSELEFHAILASKLFDEDYYRSKAKLQDLDRASLVRHYLDTGVGESFLPIPNFQATWYTRTYKVDLNPFAHYVMGGHLYCDPNPLFDTKYFLQGYSPRKGKGESALELFIKFGRPDLLDPHPLFEVASYLERYSDVRQAGIEPLGHYLRYGANDYRVPCPLFDPTFYLETYRDVKDSGQNPLCHYLEFGAREGRNPSADFDTTYYAAVAGIDHAGPVNPLTHYKLYGRKAGIIPKKKPLILSRKMTASEADCAAWLQSRSQHPTRKTPLSLPTLLLLVPDCQAQSVWPPQVLQEMVSGVPEIIVLSYEALPKTVSDLPPETLCLFADANDRIQLDELIEALSIMPASAELAVFDLLEMMGDGTSRPVLMPGANRVHVKSVGANRGRFVIRTTLLKRLTCFQSSGKPQEIFLAALEQLEIENRIRAFVHLPFILLCVPDLGAERLRIRKRLLKDATSNRSLMTGPRPDVSVVICSKENSHLLVQLIVRLLHQPREFVHEIIVVTNRPRNEFTLSNHAAFTENERVQVVQYAGEYNFSAQCNLGAGLATSKLLLFLNDDVVPVRDTWLTILVDALDDLRVAASGPLLLYPGGGVQHAGVYLGYGQVAGHGLRNASLPEDDPLFYALAPRLVSALTGAVLLVRRIVFEEVGGFDKQMATSLQDIDLCLRITGMGYDLAYEPRSLLLHCESLSIDPILDDSVHKSRRHAERERFIKRWGKMTATDPYHNPAYKLEVQSLRELQ